MSPAPNEIDDPGRNVRVAVLADTHRVAAGGPRDAPALPGPVLDHLSRADAILHAGDIVSGRLLEQLGAIAPVWAVLGNNDHELYGQLPETCELTIAGVDVAMIHDSGSRRGRARRMKRRFPGAAVVVFGHSHEPMCEAGEDGQLLFNPGSPTQRRRQPHPTMGLLVLNAGAVVDHRIVRVDDSDRPLSWT